MINTHNNIDALIPRVYVKMGKESVLKWSDSGTYSRIKKLLKEVDFFTLMGLFAKSMTSKERILYKETKESEKDNLKNKKSNIYEKRTKKYILECVNEYIRRMNIAYGSSETMKNRVSYRQLNKLIALSKKKTLFKEKYSISCYCIIIFYVMFEKINDANKLKNSKQVKNINTVISEYYKDNSSDELAKFIIDCVTTIGNQTSGTIKPIDFPSILNGRLEEDK